MCSPVFPRCSLTLCGAWWFISGSRESFITFMAQLKKQEAFPNLAPAGLSSLLSWPFLEAFSALLPPNALATMSLCALFPWFGRPFWTSYTLNPYLCSPGPLCLLLSGQLRHPLPWGPCQVLLLSVWPPCSSPAWRRPVPCRVHWLLTWLRETARSPWQGTGFAPLWCLTG